mmetsp:Transcript_33044/g.93235  ORF Transcript_33044/g.93235 Transcript_33044/m.93235 type:complete len:783 (+) Transcript_33044:2-2350(+)
MAGRRVCGTALAASVLAASSGAAAGSDIAGGGGGDRGAFGPAAGSWDHCEGTSSSSSQSALTDAQRRCCEARRVWLEIEASGGCGVGLDPEFDCRAVEALCLECNDASGAVAAYFAATSRSNATAPTGSIAVTAGRDVPRSALDHSALATRCSLPRRTARCATNVADIGLGIVLIAGLILLVLSVSTAVLFDGRVLPNLLARFQRRFLVAAPAAVDVEQPPHPPKQPRDLAAPPPVPTSLDAGLPVRFCSLRRPRDPAAASETSVEALRQAGSCDEDAAARHLACDSASVLDLPRRPSTGGSSAGRELERSRGAWPPRLARVWALRAAFVQVAAVAAFARMADALLRSVLAPSDLFGRTGHGTAGDSLADGVLMLIPELLLVLPPLLGVTLASRPPQSPEHGIPASAAFAPPCRRLPRFTAFAICVVLVELYSTLVAGAAVARAPCDMQPWRVILPYCVGVCVAVARAYSALLALRLQDEIAGACRRVLPVAFLEVDGGLPSAKSDNGAFSPAAAPPCFHGLAGAGGEFLGEQTERLDAMGVEVGLDCLALEACPTTISGGGSRGPRPTIEGWWPQPVKPPKAPQTPSRRRGSRLCYRQSLSSQAQMTYIESDPLKEEKQGCRLQLRMRILLRCSVLLVVVSATAGALIARMTAAQARARRCRVRLGREAEPQKWPSSCVTAQNATATCQAFKLIGMDPETGGVVGRSGKDIATIEECCGGCDATEGCQGWMFESLPKRCGWISFTADPCMSNPGDLSCRCLTHPGTTFGFKPTSQIIWMNR